MFYGLIGTNNLFDIDFLGYASIILSDEYYTVEDELFSYLKGLSEESIDLMYTDVIKEGAVYTEDTEEYRFILNKVINAMHIAINRYENKVEWILSISKNEDVKEYERNKLKKLKIYCSYCKKILDVLDSFEEGEILC